MAARRFPSWLKLGVFALIPVTVLFVAAETYATYAIARRARTDTDTVSGQTHYSLRIGRLPWSRRSVTPINSHGFPDAEFSSALPKDGCLHIVFAGDSFVFGDGVDSDSSFVGLVRTWTAASAPCTRVFNLGERGTTIDQQSRRVREMLDQLQPDVVILGQYQNDLSDYNNAALDSLASQPDAARRDTDVRKRFGALKLNLVRFLSYHAFGFAIQHNIHHDLLKHWSILGDSSRRANADSLMVRYETEYDALARTLAARNVAFGVIVIPSKFDILAGRFPEEPFFLGLARERGVPHLRVFPLLDQKRSPYAFLMYDGHLNELGNRLVAEHVFDWLYRQEPAPFPILRARPAHPFAASTTAGAASHVAPLQQAAPRQPPE